MRIGYAPSSHSPPLALFSNITPFSTRSAPWNPASIQSASPLSSRQSCVTGKVVSASSERNLPVVDLQHVVRPIIFSRGFLFHVEFASKVSGILRVLGSLGSWTLILHNLALESGPQPLPFRSIGDNNTA